MEARMQGQAWKTYICVLHKSRSPCPIALWQMTEAVGFMHWREAYKCQGIGPCLKWIWCQFL